MGKKESNRYPKLASQKTVIELGNKVKDRVSGLVGITIAKVEYLNGCIQFCVRPKIKKGEIKLSESCYIDEGQLEKVSEGVCVKKKAIAPGGAMDHTPRADYRG